jgi:hypothetical protein
MLVRYLTPNYEALIEWADGLFCPVDFLQEVKSC